MATVKEIAQLAGVSPTTVSRVLSQDDTLRVTSQTRARIEQLARELGYTPRRIHSRPQKQRTVGLVKGRTETDNLSSTHFYALTRAVERALSAEGYAKLVFPIENIPARSLDAIIAMGQYSPAQVAALARASENLLFLYSSPDPLRYDSICLDSYTLARTAIGYLRRLGHRRIAYMGASDILGGMRMKDPFFHAVRAAILDEDPHGDQWMFVGDYTPTSAFSLTFSLLREFPVHARPTAILYATDAMAIGGYRAVRECGLHVGADISILSVDDVPTSSYVSPPLTTFRVDVDFIGATAVCMLDDRLSGRRTQTLTVQIPLRMIQRKSCQPCVLG